mgnify:CR=1 FL=1
MEPPVIYTWLARATTVAAFAGFIGVVVWAYSRKRESAFEAASNAPFALPDDVAAEDGNSVERRS